MLSYHISSTQCSWKSMLHPRFLPSRVPFSATLQTQGVRAMPVEVAGMVKTPVIDMLSRGKCHFHCFQCAQCHDPCTADRTPEFWSRASCTHHAAAQAAPCVITAKTRAQAPRLKTHVNESPCIQHGHGLWGCVLRLVLGMIITVIATAS